MILVHLNFILRIFMSTTKPEVEENIVYLILNFYNISKILIALNNSSKLFKK